MYKITYEFLGYPIDSQGVLIVYIYILYIILYIYYKIHIILFAVAYIECIIWNIYIYIVYIYIYFILYILFFPSYNSKKINRNNINKIKYTIMLQYWSFSGKRQNEGVDRGRTCRRPCRSYHQVLGKSFWYNLQFLIQKILVMIRSWGFNICIKNIQWRSPATVT